MYVYNTYKVPGVGFKMVVLVLGIWVALSEGHLRQMFLIHMNRSK